MALRGISARGGDGAVAEGVPHVAGPHGYAVSRRLGHDAADAQADVGTKMAARRHRHCLGHFGAGQTGPGYELSINPMGLQDLCASGDNRSSEELPAALFFTQVAG